MVNPAPSGSEAPLPQMERKPQHLHRPHGSTMVFSLFFPGNRVTAPDQ